jgi:molybdopterin converting factor small subunit
VTDYTPELERHYGIIRRVFFPQCLERLAKKEFLGASQVIQVGSDVLDSLGECVRDVNVRIRVELFGVSRLAAGTKEITLDLEEGATFRDIARVLGTRYPAMIGNVIQPDGETLQEPNIFNLNARQMIQATQMGDSPNDGDRIILMSISAGG